MSNYLELLKRPIAFHRFYAQMGGSAGAGVFISQLMYWHDAMKQTRGEDWDGWFWKLAADWERETYTTRRERENGEKRLRELGILEVKKMGVPPRKYYKVNEVKLVESIESILGSESACEPKGDANLPDLTNKNDTSDKLEEISNLPDMTNKDVTSDNTNCQILQRNTESTSKSTSDDLINNAALESSKSDPPNKKFGVAENWVSAKRVRLNDAQQRVFQALYEAFGLDEDRARAIDMFLDVIWPFFGKDKDRNNQNLRMFLSAAEKACAARKLPKNAKLQPMYLTNWIAARRWEDGHSESSRMSSGMLQNQTRGECHRPFWETSGYDSQEHFEKHTEAVNGLKTLLSLKKPSIRQQDLIDRRREEVKKYAPKNAHQQTEVATG